MIRSEVLLGLPHYEITEIELSGVEVRITARYTGPSSCPHCGGAGCGARTGLRGGCAMRIGDAALRARLRRAQVVVPELQPLFSPAISRHPAVPAVQRSVPPDDLPPASGRHQPQPSGEARRHRRGHRRTLLPARTGAPVCASGIRGAVRACWASTSTSSRARKASPPRCAIWETTRSMTWCWAASELSLEAYFHRLEGKAEVKVVCMDLATNYRSLVRTHFPNARIVADRFHVIRIINHHFLNCWREIDPRRQQEPRAAVADAPPSPQPAPRPATPTHRLSGKIPSPGTHLPVQATALLPAAEEASHPQQCEILIPRFLRAVHQLRQAGLAQLVQLGQTLASWSRRSSPCGASLATTASPRAFTTKWNSSTAKPTASATSKTTDFASRYYVDNQFGFWGCPRCWRRARSDVEP